jgi:hypothetical protein
MTYRKKSQLILKSSDINNLGYNDAEIGHPPVERGADYFGQNGSINELQTSMTWNNINLRSLLGELYKDGGYYNICLEQIVFATTSDFTAFSPMENNKTFNINMSGLPFLRTYTSKNILSNQILLTTVRLDTCATPTILLFSDIENTFKLTQNVNVENVNISIYYTDLLNNVSQPTTALTKAMPNIQLIFSIYEC